MEYQNKKEKFEKEIYTLNIKYNTDTRLIYIILQ